MQLGTIQDDMAIDNHEVPRGVNGLLTFNRAISRKVFVECELVPNSYLPILPRTDDLAEARPFTFYSMAPSRKKGSWSIYSLRNDYERLPRAYTAL
jgi:hypothetical protein